MGDAGNPEYLEQLKCYKVLNMDNHDQLISKFKPYFDEIYSGPLMIAEKIILLNTNFALNIHGHIHVRENWEILYHFIKHGTKPFKYYDEDIDTIWADYHFITTIL